MFTISFAKNFKSEPLANPDNCETLFILVSTRFFTDAFFRRLKNFSADLPVNPIVNSLIMPFFRFLSIGRIGYLFVSQSIGHLQLITYGNIRLKQICPGYLLIVLL